jgi:hypothetical protein
LRREGLEASRHPILAGPCPYSRSVAALVAGVLRQLLKQAGGNPGDGRVGVTGRARHGEFLPLKRLGVVAQVQQAGLGLKPVGVLAGEGQNLFAQRGPLGFGLLVEPQSHADGKETDAVPLLPAHQHRPAET